TSFSRSIKQWRRGAVAWRDLSKSQECCLSRPRLNPLADSRLLMSTPQQWHRYCSIYLFRVPASAHTRLLVQKYQRPNCEGSSSERYSESTATISRLWGGQSVVRSTWAGPSTPQLLRSFHGCSQTSCSLSQMAPRSSSMPSSRPWRPETARIP